MVLSTFARRISKVAFYIMLSLIIARTLGSPEIWMNDDLTNRIGRAIYGPGEIGADNFYDLYFYISVITVFSITTLIYFLAMELIRKIQYLLST